MANETSVNIAPLLRRLSNIGTDADRMAKAIVQASADKIVANAKRNAPADLGKLRQSIGKESKNDGYQADIFANASYAAYIEFGTGTYVNVPSELADVASQFKGKGVGSFDDFKASIKDWMGRHGIDEKLAFVIMMSIIRKGIKAQPFLYPAYIAERAKMKNKIETAIRRYLRTS